MLEQSLRQFYAFGMNYMYLLNVREKQPVHEKAHTLPVLKYHLQLLEGLGLEVSLRASAPLLELKKELEALPIDAKCTADLAERLTAAVDATRPTVQAELDGLYAFTVQPKILDVKKLLHHIDKLFMPGIFNSLSAISRSDFEEAGKCIAFERPTAAAFHILRATEQSVRMFYKNLVRQKRIKSDLWGQLTADLRKRPKGIKHESLLNHLDHIRLHYRNPTQHPEKIYDIHEVQNLWNLCVEAVTRMNQACQPGKLV